MTDHFIFLIIGMAVVTFIPRFFPIVLLSKKEISPTFSKWMSFIPVSIFAALVASDIFFWNETLNLNPIQNIKLIPSILVFIVSYKTKSMIGSMVIGLAGITLLWVII